MKNATELSIRISGEAGQGMQTIGEVLCRACKQAGYHLFAHQDYMSRIRGGNNYFQIRIGSTQVHTLRQKADIIVCLDKASIPLNAAARAEGGILVADAKHFALATLPAGLFDVPFYDIAMRTAGKELFTNAVACGVLAGLIPLELSFIEQELRRVFADKPEAVIAANIAAAAAGRAFAQDNLKQQFCSCRPGADGQRMVLTGNDAVVLGAVKAGCLFYAGYPMSPSTPIMSGMAAAAERYGIVVEQAEDEIAAINMSIGASFAGVRAMTATSGGGFALMVEGLSLAGMTETPLVVVVAQRPGPATGFPTRTEQADLDFILSAGHGEFCRAVFTPGSVAEAFGLTVKAFAIAEKYQIPALILTDQHLAESYGDEPAFAHEAMRVERFVVAKGDPAGGSDYVRYRLTETGISPRAIPSWAEGCVYADSDEHTEAGHITEDAGLRVSMVQKRLSRKMQLLTQEIEAPVSYNADKAQTLFLGFGSTCGVIKEAAEKLGPKAGSIHLSQVWPFPAEALAGLIQKKQRVITVENNAGAQLAKLLRRETGIRADGSVLKFDGRPFDLDSLVEQLKEYI